MPQYIKLGNKKGWVREGYEGLFDEDLDELFDSPSCTVVKNQKRIRVYKINWHGEDIFIKRYNPYSIWSRIEGTLFGSKAFRSWDGAMILAENGFNTAFPLAAIDYRSSGLIEKSFYITREIKESRISVHYFKERFLYYNSSIKERMSFLRALAVLFRELHEKGIYHNDLKDYNILVSHENGGWRLYLLDLEGIRHFNDISKKKRIKNLVQIYRTLGEQLTWPDKIAFFMEYSHGKEWKGLIRKVLKEAAIEDIRKNRRNHRLKKERA